MVSNIKNLQGNKNNEILKLMKTVTIGEKDGIKQGLNMNCNIKLLLSFFFFFFSGFYRNASLHWKHTEVGFFPVCKLAIISFIIKAEPSFLSISKAIPWHLFY